MNRLLALLFIVPLIYSCRTDKEDDTVRRQVNDEGVVIATPYIWKTSLHEKEPASNSYIKHPIVYNDNIVVPTTDGDAIRTLSLMDSKDGKILWNWNDLFEIGTEYMDIAFHYQYKELLAYQYGSRSYCINMDNGKSEWRIRRDRSFDVRIDPYGQYYFIYAFITNSIGYEEQIAFKCDIQTGNISEFLTANFTYDNPDCVRAVTFVNQVPGQDNLLLVTYAENLPDWITQSYFGLYDTILNEWVWDKMQIAPPKRTNNPYYPPQIVNGKIYAEISNSIVCHDLATGKQLWKRDFTNDFMFSGFIIEDGMLIGNNEDLFAVCLDLEFGNILWQVRTAGTCGSMSYLNGIVYFVGGSTPHLFAIEANTGKIVWKINAALLGEGFGAGFRTNAVYVLPAKDNQPAKVIALSNLYAYCFEAYR